MATWTSVTSPHTHTILLPTPDQRRTIVGSFHVGKMIPNVFVHYMLRTQ